MAQHKGGCAKDDNMATRLPSVRNDGDAAMRSKEASAKKRVGDSKVNKKGDVLDQIRKQSPLELRAKLEKSIRCVRVLSSKESDFAIQNIVDMLVLIVTTEAPAGSGAAFRDAGSSATQLQLENVERSARALAHDIDGLNEPATLIVASLGLADRVTLLAFVNRIEKKVIEAKARVASAARAGDFLPPKRGRRPGPVPYAVARMVAHYFEAMVGSKPTADGRQSDFVTMLASVLEAAGIAGNARHYAAQAVAGRKLL